MAAKGRRVWRALLACEAGVLVAALGFHLAVRPAALAELDNTGAVLSPLVRMGLSSWWLPGTAGLSLALAAVAWFGTGKASTRLRLLAASVVLGGSAFTAAVAVVMTALMGG